MGVAKTVLGVVFGKHAGAVDARGKVEVTHALAKGDIPGTRSHSDGRARPRAGGLAASSMAAAPAAGETVAAGATAAGATAVVSVSAVAVSTPQPSASPLKAKLERVRGRQRL